MAVRPIVRFPDSRLRQTSAPVKAVDDDVRRVVADMTDSMYAQNGAGLAAIQIGEPLRIFIVEGQVAGGAEQDPPKVFINPEILEISSESQTGDEGCLSFPNIFVPVKRGMRARVRAMDLEGNIFEAEGAELYARANSPSPSASKTLPSRSRARTLARMPRLTGTKMSGNDRQPSSPVCASSEMARISGLMNTLGGASSAPPATWPSMM